MNVGRKRDSSIFSHEREDSHQIILSVSLILPLSNLASSFPDCWALPGCSCVDTQERCSCHASVLFMLVQPPVQKVFCPELLKASSIFYSGFSFPVDRQSALDRELFFHISPAFIAASQCISKCWFFVSRPSKTAC